MGVKILFFSHGTLGQNSMFPEKGGQNSIFFPSALKKGGSKPRSLPTNFTPPPPRAPGQQVFNLENRNGSWRIELLRKAFWGRGTVPGCWVTVSLMLCDSAYTLKQIIKIVLTNIHENNGPFINYRTYTYVVIMDPPNIFLVRSHTKCSSPINYLFYGRLYHEIMCIMQGKWYLNRYIIVSTWHWDITKVTIGLFQ